MRTINVLGRDINVSETIIDRVVAYFNPVKGVERFKAKAQMAAFGGYTAGARDHRGLRNWVAAETSANAAVSQDLRILRARSRDLVRNVPIATGAISTVVTNVVGDGLVLQSLVDRDVLGLSHEAADAWQRQAQREFAIWSKRPDFTDRLNFDEVQALVMRSVLEAGDLLVARRLRQDSRDVYGLKLQLVEADRISNPNLGLNTATMVDGVQLDPDGRPTGYSICNMHPGDWTLGKQRQWKTYEKGSTVTGSPLILHLYDQLRPDQARGIPYLAPVIAAIKQLGDYADAEIRAAVVSALFTVFVKAPVVDDGEKPITGTNDSTDNVDPQREMALGSGAVVELEEGEDVTFADPKRPNTAYQAFVEAMAKHIGVALELPYEVLLKSFTASYSASRAALEMAWQFFRKRRSWLAWKFCQPVYEWVITEAIVNGRLAAPGFFADPVIREAWLGSEWIGPSHIQLDPQKEAAADMLDLSMNTKSRAKIIMERTGGDFESTFAQLAKEKKMLDAAGLPTAASASEALQPPVKDKPGNQNE